MALAQFRVNRLPCGCMCRYSVGMQSNPSLTSAFDFRSATLLARTHERAIAWGTIWLCLVVVIGFWGIAWGAAAGFVPLWLAIPLNALLAYAAYTPAHEAVHGNVHRIVGQPQSEGTWLNNFVGTMAASALLHNFPMHQLSHLAHHAHTNDPERDPDHWMAVRGWHRVLLRAFSLMLVHYASGLRLSLQRKSDGKRRIVLGLLQNALWLGWVALLAVTYEPGRALAATVLSAWLGSGLLAWAFDWLPHYPHISRERFKNTRTTQFAPWLNGFMTRFFLFQNYHHIHHLWPRVPFSEYQRVHEKMADYLVAQGTPVQTVGIPK
jgi:beta-carotene hydroxylase